MVDELSDVNYGLRQGLPPESLAYANSAYCGEYLFQGTCPAFWKWFDKCAFADSRRAAILEVVNIDNSKKLDLHTAHVGALVSCRPSDRRKVLGLLRSALGSLSNSPQGQQWRIVSAMARADDRIRVNLSTVLLGENSVARLVVDSSAADLQTSDA